MSCRSKKAAYRLQQTETEQVDFSLSLFRIKCSLKSEQGNKQDPRLPEVNQMYVVKAKRDKLRQFSSMRLWSIFDFLNAFLITLLKLLIEIFLKLQIAPIYI